MTPSAAPRLRDQLRIVVVGHVDHGKSTLIGRLLHDTGSLPDGKLQELETIARRRGMALEWSFVLDAFQAERDQAITIDTTQIWFKTPERDYVIIDAPGHREFLKNMVSGAAQADAAILVIDAGEGVREQTRRHAYLLRLLGLDQVVVAVNKMDMVGWSEARFAAIAGEIEAYLRSINVRPAEILPISARHGDNVASSHDWEGWSSQPRTLLSALGRFQPSALPVHRPLRISVQDVYHFDDRVIAGRVESGVLRVGDQVLFSPSNREARVRSIESWAVAAKPVEAKAGDSVAFTLDDQLFVERGQIVSHVEDAPLLTTVFRARIFWLGQAPLMLGQSYRVKLLTAEAEMRVEAIEAAIDSQTLDEAPARQVERNGVAEIILRGRRLFSVDPYAEAPETGRFVLLDGHDIVGGGQIDMRDYPDQRPALKRRSSNIHEVDHLLPADSRSLRNGHSGAVIWLTGLSGAGKSTIAMQVEQRLFARGFQTYVLDGDNVRAGLCGDLGFSPADRAENIRRVGEVAALFADAGVIVLTAFISPYRSDRERARACRPAQFHEVYIRAGVETCARRDPKGLYRKAMAGEIREFTGVSAPYEPPETAELVVDTEAMSIEDSVELLVNYIAEKVGTRKS